MAKIPLVAADPTLEAIDAAMVAAAGKRGAGMNARISCGSIADECSRKLWYLFRWAVKAEIADAETQRIWADGHKQEAIMADRLRLVDGIELHTVDPTTGKQIQYYDLDGHMTGKLDGVIVGLKQAPATWHVWEHKAVNEKKFNELNKLKATVGEKAALLQWDEVYHGQHQLYMHYTGFTRGYLTCSTPGGRNITSVRTDYDQEFCLRQIARGARVVGAQHPLEKAFKPDFFKCKFCPAQDICHKSEWAERNCRTCLHSSPAPNGTWKCERWNKVLDYKEQQQGCPAHKFIPSLVPGKQIDAGPTWVEYEMPDGSRWKDSEDGRV